MEPIYELISIFDWKGILAFTSKLNHEKRIALIQLLKATDLDAKFSLREKGKPSEREARMSFYERVQKINYSYFYALMCCARSRADLRLIQLDKSWGNIDPLTCLLGEKAFEPLIDYFSKYPPDYLVQEIKTIEKNQFSKIEFKQLWMFYTKGWIPFDEAQFIRHLFNLNGTHENDHLEDAEFFIAHPEFTEKVFLLFYKYELPVLDLIKSKSIDYSNGLSAKATVYWTEIIKVLIQNNAIKDRAIVGHLIASLLNNWKKPHLDWHVRILELLAPTDKELLQFQSLLFAVLSTGNSSLINYAMQNISRIQDFEAFDIAAFQQSLSHIFSKEKVTKSILLGLQILENTILAKNKADLSYREDLAVIFINPDTKVQERTANLLVQYFNDDELKDVVMPYLTYLQTKTKEILNVNEAAVVEELIDENQNKMFGAALSIPNNWDQLMLQIGTCIASKSAVEIELFYDALNTLQFEIPTDFAKQLKPYTKQIVGKPQATYALSCLSVFLESWTNQIFEAKFKIDNCSAPFYGEKADWMLYKLKKKSNLPILSTPTHEPFYVHPAILLEKLEVYEASQEPVYIEDLIVACNRVIFELIDDHIIQKANELTGYYAKAIQYLFGAHNKVEISDETLALWAQITRIKNPSEIFEDFEGTKAAKLASVIHPFVEEFKIEVEVNKYATWHRLVIGDHWNYSIYRHKLTKNARNIYFNAAPNDKGFRHEIADQFALNPSYLDAHLCRYVPDTASGNEVDGFDNCLYPLQFLLRHRIKIYHSGWIYIAVCLLFEKAVSRDLAAEYIQLAISRNENLHYLVSVIGKLIGIHFAPINRLYGYFEKRTAFEEIKTFQWQVMRECILQIDPQKQPANSKKLKAFFTEWSLVLKQPIEAEMQEKFKLFKWK